MFDQKLETLIRVCEENNFTRAAEKLSLTQPAVSRHVRNLEEELGIKLFNRSENGMILTHEGETVLKYAKRIKAVYGNMLRAIEDERKHVARITIGMTHTSESNPVAEVLAKYCNQKDDVRITIVTDTITNLYRMLDNYEIDIAVAEGKRPDGQYNALLLDTDTLVLVVSNNNPLAKKSMVTIDDLKKEKMILRLPNSGTRNLFVSHLESMGMSIDEFNVILEVDNIATIKDLIRRDFGVSILAKSACLDELKKGKITVLPVENLSMIREINLVYHKDFEHIDVLREFIKMYNDAVKIYA